METQRQSSFYTAPGLAVVNNEPIIQVPIGKVIADLFGVEPEALELPFTRTKKREICDARFVLINYISTIKKKGPSFTGKQVGRGHADVISAVKKYNNYFDTEKDYREKVMTVLHQINSGKVLLPEYCKS